MYGVKMVASLPRYSVPLLALALLVGCTSEAGGQPAAGGVSSPPTATSGTPTPSLGAGPYRAGDCLELGDDALKKVGCDQPHEYEVMLSDRLPADVPDSYPPPVDTVIRPVCRSTLPTYLDNPNAVASRLESETYWPTQEQWDGGDRWFACLVGERGPDNRPVRRTGTLAGALANGLGAFQRCLVGEPLSEEPTQVVPCDRPHRSEALPEVLVMDEPPTTSSPPSAEMVRLIDRCEKMVDEYVGGERSDVDAAMLAPLPEKWRNGAKAAVCYAVAETPVTGPLRGAS